MSMNNHGGKGSASRPLGVSRDEFGDKFEGIFGQRKRTNGGWVPPPLNDQQNKDNVTETNTSTTT